MTKTSDEAIIAALQEHGSQRKAAKALGIHRRTLERRAKSLVLRGHSPEHGMTKLVPEGFSVKGVSSYYDRDGKMIGQWVKSAQDRDAVAKMLEAAFAGLKDELPRAKPIQAPQGTDEDLVNTFIITDYHLGMLAWHEETGADWDIQIAEDTLVAWFELAIRQAPAAKSAIFAQLGDFLHWDGMDAVTPASKHLLDADTRFQKLVRVAIRVVRRVIAMLLEKHEHVHVLMAEGNHDPASSIWLREWLAAIYEEEPRVSVEVSPDPYYCYEHGSTAIFFHHGHKKKLSGLDNVLVAKFKEIYGRSKNAYAHTGHLHHVEVKETNLMIVEQHRTLAAPDAYAARGGWMSGRSASVISYSRAYGEAGRVTIPIERVTAHMDTERRAH